MEEIKILYIDDKPDPSISEYLDINFSYENKNKLKVSTKDLKFNVESNYEYLLENQKLQEANIVLIDSNLFENKDIGSGKFTGEEFKVILKKIYPFIEVLVITQNKITEKYGTISKFDFSKGKNPGLYYDEELKPVINKKIEDIIAFRKISKKLSKNECIEKVLIERIMNSLEGINEYNSLSSKKIDELINEFKKLEAKIL